MTIRLHGLVMLLGEHLNRRSAVEIIASECEMPLAVLDFEGAACDWWVKILRKARELKRLDELFEVLRRALPAFADQIGLPAEWGAPQRRPALLRPGSAFDSYWDVGREGLEAIHLTQLEGSTAPVVVAGPRGYGKTWYLERLLERFRARHPQSLALRIDSEFFRLQNGLTFLQRFAHQVVNEAGLDWERASASWDLRTPDMSLQRVWVKEIFARTEAPVLLTLDVPEAFWSNPEHENFFAVVRAWVNNRRPPWDRLRLIVTYSTTPAIWSREPTQSPLNVLPQELPDFSADEILALAARYELAWSEGEVRPLLEKTGGYPRLCAEFLYSCRTQPERSPTSLLWAAARPGGVFRAHLEHLAHELRAHGLVQALLAVHQRGERPPWEAYRALHTAGLIRFVEADTPEGGRFELRFPLLHSVLQWL